MALCSGQTTCSDLADAFHSYLVFWDSPLGHFHYPENPCASWPPKVFLLCLLYFFPAHSMYLKYTYYPAAETGSTQQGSVFRGQVGRPSCDIHGSLMSPGLLPVTQELLCFPFPASKPVAPVSCLVNVFHSQHISKLKRTDLL